MGEASSLSNASLMVLDFGLWTLDFGLRSWLGFGLWTLVLRLWTLDSGIWPGHRPLVKRCLVRQCGNRNVGDRLTFVNHAHVVTVAHAANHHGVEVPLAKDVDHFALAA